MIKIKIQLKKYYNYKYYEKILNSKYKYKKINEKLI